MHEYSSLETHKNGFLSALSIILIYGVIMVYSASYMFARDHYDNSWFFFLKQIGFLAIGLGLAFVIYRSKIEFWIKYALPLHIIAALCMVGTLIPEFGATVKGASRWLKLGGFSFQPGEILKYTTLLLSVQFFQLYEERDFKERIKHASFLLVPVLIYLAQPDFGSFMICSLLMMFVAFLGPFPRKWLWTSCFVAIVACGMIMVLEPYRVQRLMTFLDPWKAPKTTGFQVIQSYLAFASGSIFGQGLGNSNEKLFYLPESYNDFIFSVIGEELGFVGVLLTVVLFGLLLYFAMRMVLEMRERLAILVYSVVFLLIVQVCLNMGVVLGLLPTKGLNLPFISYGGSSLISNLFGVGLILSAYRESRREEEEEAVSYEYASFGQENESQTIANDRFDYYHRPSQGSFSSSRLPR